MSPQSRASVVVLVSGRGSNMQALLEHARADGASFRIAAVISDRPDAGALEVAAAHGIPVCALPAAGAERTAYDTQLAGAIDAYAPALIVLAGFMRILSAEFVARYAGRILNIHPSLLPKYAGLHTHRRALAGHDAEHGATVHFVTTQLDGGPRVLQARLPVASNEDEASLAARVLRREHWILPMAVDWYCSGRLRCDGEQAWLDHMALSEPVTLTEPESD